MRRKARKAVHLCFLIALFLIIYNNTSGSKTTTYPWSKIRYQSKSKSLPPTRGICPGLASTTKPALIVSRVQSDSKQWLDSLSDLYHLCIYTADAPPNPSSDELQVPANRAHEAMPYLTFLIDNYAALPAAGMVFIHGSRKAWHNDAPDYDNVPLLKALNVSNALQGDGYHNLRCDWSVSTCPMDKAPQGSMGTKFQAVMMPTDGRAVSDAALPGALETLFGKGAKLGAGHSVRSQCCAQFVVGRENVWRHERAEYVALRQWLLDAGKGKGAASKDDKIAGRVVSYLWHVLFLGGQSGGGSNGGVHLAKLNEKACPSAEACYCKLYGRCGLEGCDKPGRCRGQYILPLNLRLPKELR